MGNFAEFMSYAVLAVFAQNLVLTGGIGASRLIRAVRKPGQLLPYGLTVTLFTVAAGIITYPVNLLIKDSEAGVYLRPVLFALCITVIYIAVYLTGKRFLPKLYEKYGNMLTSCAFNGIVAGVPFIVSLRAYSFAQAIGFCFGSAVGFMLAALLVSEGLRVLDSAELPRAFRGIPASLLYIGILSLAFAGFSGTGAF